MVAAARVPKLAKAARPNRAITATKTMYWTMYSPSRHRCDDDLAVLLVRGGEGWTERNDGQRNRQTARGEDDHVLDAHGTSLSCARAGERASDDSIELLAHCAWSKAKIGPKPAALAKALQFIEFERGSGNPVSQVTTAGCQLAVALESPSTSWGEARPCLGWAGIDLRRRTEWAQARLGLAPCPPAGAHERPPGPRAPRTKPCPHFKPLYGRRAASSL